MVVERGFFFLRLYLILLCRFGKFLDLIKVLNFVAAREEGGGRD